MSTHTVSIVLPTYQGERYLRETLPAIRAQSYNGTVEIIGLDNESTDQSVALLKQYGATLQTIPRKAFSHGYARNLGVRLAKGDVIIFLSQDALPVGTDWLAQLVEGATQTGVGAVYTRQLARPDATPFERYFHLTLYPAESATYQLDPNSKTPALEQIFFSNVCSAAWREICLAHPFDETLIMSEDQAFARAVLQSGYQTRYLAEVCVIHSHHYDLPTLFRRNFDSAYSLRTITQDNWGGQAGRGLSYIKGEAAYVIQQKRFGWLAFLPIYEAVRIMGRVLGRYAHRLPSRWRTLFSLHRGYWSRKATPV
jgi:rhamnosyltransferase